MSITMSSIYHVGHIRSLLSYPSFSASHVRWQTICIRHLDGWEAVAASCHCILHWSTCMEKLATWLYGSPLPPQLKASLMQIKAKFLKEDVMWALHSPWPSFGPNMFNNTKPWCLLDTSIQPPYLGPYMYNNLKWCLLDRSPLVNEKDMTHRQVLTRRIDEWNQCQDLLCPTNVSIMFL